MASVDSGHGSSPTLATDAQPHVFVTGAGFTRAVIPSAPLLIDDFDNEALARKVDGLPNASRLLEWERRQHAEAHINIERLMTRLDQLMPYDYATDADNAADEYAFLLSELKRAFLRRLNCAREHTVQHSELRRFARYCVANGTCCITFNYYDFLDEALNHTEHWDPGRGYGFLCPYTGRTLEDLDGMRPRYSEFTLLKLHGSGNWRSKLGHRGRVPVDAIVHHDTWTMGSVGGGGAVGHLEPEPVIVPPVLSKTHLVEQPVLRVVWSQAFSHLQRAREVTFIGYSFPVTDIASRTLFSEALEDLPRDRIRVVNLAGDRCEENKTREAYREVLGDIPDARFHFKGASHWIADLPA